MHADTHDLHGERGRQQAPLSSSQVVKKAEILKTNTYPKFEVGSISTTAFPMATRAAGPPASRALKRARVANYIVQSNYNVDTRDYMDHTFSGVMFDVQAKAQVPLEWIELQEVWVRGALGPMSIWMSPGGFSGKHEKKSEWKCIFEGEKKASMNCLVSLKVNPPLRLSAGQTVGIYIHSKQYGDEGIVYNNRRSRVTHEDPHLRILPGLAHISSEPFSRVGYWGGGAWRNNREFVGRITYGVKWMLWNPKSTIHERFPPLFRAMVDAVVQCHRTTQTGLGVLPTAVIYYILNMLPWDWAGQDDIKASLEASKRDTEESFGWRGPRAIWRYVEPGSDSEEDSNSAGPAGENGDQAEDGEDDDEDDDEDDEDYVPPERLLQLHFSRAFEMGRQ